MLINQLFVMSSKPEVTKEQVHAFLMGSNPMEHIIKIEGDYNDDKIYVIYRDENNKLKTDIDNFYPFVWCKQSTGRFLYNGDRKKLKDAMAKYNLGCKGLRIHDTDGNVHPRMENGYRVMFYAKTPMAFSKFQKFFEEGGRPIYPKPSDKSYGLRDYICVAPNEQYMISTGKRMFKGYEDYDDLLRLEWDLETEGLDPNINAISQIGIRTNKGFEKIISIQGEGEEKLENEMKGLSEFFQIVREIQPDVMTGHNTENFDWNFIDVRLKKRGLSLFDYTQQLFYGKGIYKKQKEAVLKLGGEMEYYYPTVMWGHNLTDSLFAVRRAQALDSNMKKADLKYVTKYSKLNKPNRVYVPGKVINQTWSDTSKTYAFNDENGEWFKITDENLNKTFINCIGEKLKRYSLNNDGTLHDNKENRDLKYVTGRYIVERYLLDDLYETDKVELRYNQSNFLVGKMLPVSFEKMCTMGTAAIWKYIMLAWSYEHDLAIPELINTKPFTGGLSRLLKTGFVDRIVKLDFNSLYPSIILSFNIKTPIDVMGVMNAILEYILTEREYYKELKGEYNSKAKKIKKQIENNPNSQNIKELKEEQSKYETEAARNDKMQLPLKITGNGYFGSYGSGQPFPWSDLVCAEETTCIGRMCLRLLINHFTNIGYIPIVGDSFTEDTPLFIKYNKTNDIDIVPISKLINEKKIKKDKLGREYDTSKKDFKVLCRSGWMEVSYIYRHKTDKNIYCVTDNDCYVEVTEDHSLFNVKQEKIIPNEINENTKLEYYNGGNIISNKYTFDKRKLNMCAVLAAGNREHALITKEVLNSTVSCKKYFLDRFEQYRQPNKEYSKQILASLQYIKLCVENN